MVRWPKGPILHRLRGALSLTVFLLRLNAVAAPPATPIEQRFDAARKNPLELYAFLLRMPKGGDLHVHLGGAIYAETYLRLAAEDGLCLDLRAHAIVAPSPGTGAARCGENGVEAWRAQTDNTLASAMIDSLSMRNFVPGRESGHDHFFAAFAKFGPYQPRHRGELLAEVVRRAAEQNESYLELMTLSGAAANALGTRTGFSGDFAADREKLVAGGLPQIVDGIRSNLNDLERGQRAALGCETAPESPACRVVVRHIYQVFRESPKEQVFAQVLAGFMLASADPRVVGINFVQPEDGATSMRDYHLQMQMVDYVHKLYPKGQITLHAGELAPGLVPPDGLRFHIRDAVELGHAGRIGHGVSIMYETNASQLLDLMKQRRVMVEINLSSNDLILGVRGKEHPLPVYRRHGVPVALWTDDEGVSRTHLTEEYLRSATIYDLSYADLKQIARNSIEYSFAEPDEKARLLEDLDRRFRAFEKAAAR